MQLSLKQKLISASLSAVVLMATVLTWLAASNLQQQTNENILDRVQNVATTATSGIEDWINIRCRTNASITPRA